MNRLTLLSALACAGLSITSYAGPSKGGETCAATKTTAAPGEKNIVETAVAAGTFKTLATALQSAGLVEALQGKGPFTVFAPTDEAFARIPAATLQSLLKPENKGKLASILTYHVVPGLVASADVVKLNNAASLNGQRLAIEVVEGVVSVAGSKVVKTDIQCTNGVIHVIDTVMMPSSKNVVETAVAAGKFKTLAAALQAGGLVEALQGKGPFTVFAPTDEAFAALPAGTLDSLLLPENREKLVAILKYHVVPGRVYSDQLTNGAVATLSSAKVDVKVMNASAKIGGASVVSADIDATNGVIHVIDKVLIPAQ